MPVDPEISLGVQPVSAGNPLTTLDTFAQLQNRLNQNRLFQATMQAKQAIPEVLAGAVDPSTGQIDPEQAQKALLTDPRTAGFGGAEFVNQLRQLELTKQQITNAKLDMGIKSTKALSNVFASAAASDNPAEALKTSVPTAASLLPPELQPGFIAAASSYFGAIKDLPPAQQIAALKQHFIIADKATDALTLARANATTGQTQQQLTEPTVLGVSPTGGTITGTRGQFQEKALGTSGTGTGAPVQTTPLGPLGTQVAQSESGGVATAKSTTSTAEGPHQFITGTWNALAQKHPELGLTPNGRTDPEQSQKAFEAYAQDNAQSLSRAGLPVNPQNITLAHRYGPEGAIKILQAPTDTPVEKVLSLDAIKANNLAGKTTADLLKSVAGFGSEQQTLSQPTAGAGVVTSLGPGESKTLTNLSDYENGLNEAVQAMRPLSIAMKAERDASARFQMGGGAEVRAEVGKLLQAAKNAGAPVSQELIDKVANGSIADTQTFKAAMTPVIMGQFKQAVQGTGRGLMLEAKAYFDRYPGITTDPAAYENISNMISRGAQQMVDEQQQLVKFKQGVKSGSIKDFGLTDFPAWYNKQLIDKGELAFPTQTGYAKGSVNKGAKAQPKASPGAKPSLDDLIPLGTAGG